MKEKIILVTVVCFIMCQNGFAQSDGVSTDAKYVDEVMVFTMQKGGHMYDASIGGQKFKYEK